MKNSTLYKVYDVVLISLGTAIGAVIYAAFVAFTTAVVMLTAGKVQAADSASFFGSFVDDGSCESDQVAVSAEYKHEAENRDVHAYVRTAPSGGDCRQDAVTYSLSAEQRFDLEWNRSVDALIKIAADSRSTAALYGLSSDAGTVLARPDGGALFPATLPAGRAETVAGIFGVSFDVGAANIDLGANVVPVDWANGSQGRTFHFGLSIPLGPVDFELATDVGEDTFGDIAFTWAGETGATAAVRYAFGLDVLDAGVPASQIVAGAPFTLLGAPKSSSLILELGVRFDM